MINIAIKKLIDEKLSCVVCDNEKVVFTSYDKSIMPLFNLLLEDKTAINDKYVADKIIGKAVAILLVYGGAKEVYGHLISTSAIEFLINNNIKFSYDIEVEMINNRNKDGMCPMEQQIMDIDNANDGYLRLKEFIIRRDKNK